MHKPQLGSLTIYQTEATQMGLNERAK